MQSQKRNGPQNAKAIKQRQKRNRPLNAKAIKQSQKRNALLKGNGSGRVLNLLARRKECDSGSPWASENTNEAFKRIKLPKDCLMSSACCIRNSVIWLSSPCAIAIYVQLVASIFQQVKHLHKDALSDVQPSSHELLVALFNALQGSLWIAFP
ncbi:hypothetical protein EMCRGX_G021560 [Ephydatia muelleri]